MSTPNLSAGSFAQFAARCDALAATRSRLKKRAIVAEYLATLDDADAALAANFLIGRAFAECDARNLGVGGSLISAALREAICASDADLSRAYRQHGDLGDAAGMLYRERSVTPEPTLTLAQAEDLFTQLAANTKRNFRLPLLTATLQCATAPEATYLIKIMLSDMRTGTKQSMVEESIAVASNAALDDVRRAVLYTGDLGRVVLAARHGELDGLRMSLFHPLGFMLASPVETAEEAFERLLPQVVERELSADDAEAAMEAAPERTLLVEDKFDGMRAQIHCGHAEEPERVVIYSRNREDITASFPELARAFAHFPVPCIFDGEVLGWDASQHRALPFATFSNRLGRKIVPDELLRSTPVAFMAFDILLLGDELLLDTPLHTRRLHLERAVELQRDSRASLANMPQDAAPANALFAFAPVEEPVPPSPVLLSRIARPATVEQLEAEFVAAREQRGNEGLMVKDPESLYTPGRRGLAWLKIKRELATLDVVITGAEFGNGRRAGILSDYTFAVQDGGTLRNVGKAYSGLTDEEILRLSAWCMEHTVRDFGHFRTVDAEIVLEVAFNNVMRSTRHDSGFALRFPRILRIRDDKPVAEIDTLARVEEVYQSQPDKPAE